MFVRLSRVTWKAAARRPYKISQDKTICRTVPKVCCKICFMTKTCYKALCETSCWSPSHFLFRTMSSELEKGFLPANIHCCHCRNSCLDFGDLDIIFKVTAAHPNVQNFVFARYLLKQNDRIRPKLIYRIIVTQTRDNYIFDTLV